MSETLSAHFTCGSCGRQYPWRAAIAGRKAKCGCGVILTVPQTPDAPEPDLYGLSEPASADPIAAESVESPPIDYATPQREKHFTFDNLVSPIRDIYGPTALIVAGFAGLAAWTMVRLSPRPEAVAIILLLGGIATVIKTMLLIGIAFMVAKSLELSFGGFWSATLKFAGMLVFTDAVLIWTYVIMREIVPSGRIYGSGTVTVLLGSAVMACLLHYLFEIDTDEVGGLAVGLTITSLIAWLVMLFVLNAILTAILAPATPPAPSPAPVASGPPPVAITQTPQDRDIAQRIASRKLFAVPKNWPDTGQLLSRMRGAGVTNIYMELGTSSRRGEKMLYFELPADAASRARCIQVYQDYCRERRMDPDPANIKDAGQQFLAVLARQ